MISSLISQMRTKVQRGQLAQWQPCSLAHSGCPPVCWVNGWFPGMSPERQCQRQTLDQGSSRQIQSHNSRFTSHGSAQRQRNTQVLRWGSCSDIKQALAWRKERPGWKVILDLDLLPQTQLFFFFLDPSQSSKINLTIHHSYYPFSGFPCFTFSWSA